MFSISEEAARQAVRNGGAPRACTSPDPQEGKRNLQQCQILLTGLASKMRKGDWQLNLVPWKSLQPWQELFFWSSGDKSPAKVDSRKSWKEKCKQKEMHWSSSLVLQQNKGTVKRNSKTEDFFQRWEKLQKREWIIQQSKNRRKWNNAEIIAKLRDWQYSFWIRRQGMKREGRKEKRRRP